MQYKVVVRGFEGVDIYYEIGCRWHFVAIAVKAFFNYFGWAHVDINKKGDEIKPN